MYSYSVCCFSRQMLSTIKYDLVNIMGWDNHFKLSLSWIGLLNLGHVIFLFGSWKGITLGTLQFCWDTQHPRWKGQNALHPININRATLILSSCASSCYSNSAVPPQCFFLRAALLSPRGGLLHSPSTSSCCGSSSSWLWFFFFLFLHFPCGYGFSSFLLLPPLPAPLFFFFLSNKKMTFF